MKHNYLLSLILLLCFILGPGYIVMAQQEVSGTVTDATSGEGLPGVNIVEKGTVNGTVTDIDGNYRLTVGENATLVFSSVGYTNEEVPVGNQTTIDMSLAEDIQALSEVVVVGYGTQEKKEITSSVASVNAEDFNGGNVNDPAQLIQGKVAGLTISRPGGDPNGGFNIRLRGLSTVGANTEPLIVIDGVIGASLNSVDPNDIATMDVLKDGSAAAIYGTRGSSGVILITTKKGKEGQAEVSYNGYLTLENIGEEIDILTPGEYRNFPNSNDLGSSTVWFDEITQTGVTQVHNVSLSGGTSQTSYRLSVNLRDVEGIQQENGFTQLNGRLNLTQRALNDKLSLSSNISATTKNAELAFPEAFRYATIFNPTAPVRVDANTPGFNPADFERFGGFFETGAFDFFNPVALIKQNTKEERVKQILMNIRAEYDFSDIIPGFRAAGFYAQQRESILAGEFYSKQSQFRGINNNGLAQRTTEDKFNQLIEATVNYDNNIGDLTLALLGGYSWQEFVEERFGVRGGDFLRNDVGFNNLSFANDFLFGQGQVGTLTPIDTSPDPANPTKLGKETNKLIAFFGRVNLNYRGTYFLSASIRREGSTRFGENNKWGNFPAVSAGITLSNLFEIPTVDNLKLRGSFGVTGNQPSFNLLSKRLVGPVGFFLVGGQFVPSFGPISNANPDLQWEKKREFDVGLDFSLLEARLTGSIDWYTRRTEDLILLLDVPVPPNLFPSTWTNAGELKNNGIEVSLNYLAIENTDFSWEPSVTFSTFNTELTEFPDPEQEISNLGAPGLNGVNLINVIRGDEIGQIWGWEFERIGEGGEWIFRDLDNNGTINNDDKTVIGNGLPDFELGINNSFTFKNWDLNFFLRGAFGHDLVNTFRAFYEPPSVINQFNLLASSQDILELTDQAAFSSFQVEGASFLKLDNATLGYNFNIPEAGLFSKFNNIRLYVSGQNLFTISDYSGVDPEVRFADAGSSDNGGDPPRKDNPDPLAPGIDRRSTYFQTWTVTFGVNFAL